MVLAAFSAGAGGFTGPIRSAAIPKMVGGEQLIAAYSLNQIVMNLALSSVRRSPVNSLPTWASLRVTRSTR